MVYEPGSLRKLGFFEALYLALFPSTSPALVYTFYQPGERGTLGRVINRELKILLGLIGTLNALLVPPSLILMLIVTPIGMILSLPYHGFRWVFHQKDVSLDIPVFIRILSFPGATLIWILFAPVKALQVMCVLLTSLLGPKDIRLPSGFQKGV